jgi:hypothetical protein
MFTPVTLIATELLFVKVAVWAGPVVPTACPENVRVPGETSAKGTPFAAKVTDCGDAAALSVNVSKALRLPKAVGVTLTLTEQVPFGTRVAPVQVSELLAKSPGLAPATATAEMVRLAEPRLVTVSVCGPLVVLMT